MSTFFTCTNLNSWVRSGRVVSGSSGKNDHILTAGKGFENNLRLRFPGKCGILQSIDLPNHNSRESEFSGENVATGDRRGVSGGRVRGKWRRDYP